MNLIMPFDTETTGIFEWSTPSDDPCQPHLVQLAALLVDAKTREITESMDVLIKPDGWSWDENDEAFKLHGITMEQAMDEGISETEALDQFIALYHQCSLRIAHNSTFDNRAIRCALKRYRPELISDEEWKDKSRYYCTLINSRKIMGGNKGHTLTECYKHFTGKTLEDAHTAMADARACLDVYWAIQDLKEAA